MISIKMHASLLTHVVVVCLITDNICDSYKKKVSLFCFMQFLIGAGMKKVVLVGIGPIGCAPNFLSSYNSSVGECIPEINSLVQEYNDNLNLLTLRLRSEFPDSRIIFCDIFKGVYDIILNAKEYGKADLFFF